MTGRIVPITSASSAAIFTCVRHRYRGDSGGLRHHRRQYRGVKPVRDFSERDTWGPAAHGTGLGCCADGVSPRRGEQGESGRNVCERMHSRRDATGCNRDRHQPRDACAARPAFRIDPRCQTGEGHMERWARRVTVQRVATFQSLEFRHPAAAFKRARRCNERNGEIRQAPENRRHQSGDSEPAQDLARSG